MSDDTKTPKKMLSASYGLDYAVEWYDFWVGKRHNPPDVDDDPVVLQITDRKKPPR